MGLQDGGELEPKEEAETVRHQPARGAVTGRDVVAHGAQTRWVHHVEPSQEKNQVKFILSFFRLLYLYKAKAPFGV